LLEYAGRMQKAGQLEEAFRALKKFAEMTPGQEDIYQVLAEQAQAMATTKEAKDQVARILADLESKDRQSSQRRSRMSRSQITGEVIPEEPKPKKGELIFLEIDDVPTPGRKSGATAVVPEPPPPPKAAPAPPPAPRPAPPPAPKPAPPPAPRAAPAPPP